MRQRKQLLSQVPESGLQLTERGSASNMDRLAQQLKANGADEYNAYTSFASVFFRGVGELWVLWEAYCSSSDIPKFQERAKLHQFQLSRESLIESRHIDL